MATTKTVLFVHQSSDLYGSDKALLLHVLMLDRSRFYPIVLLPLHGPLVLRFQEAGVEVHVLPLCRVGRADLSLWGLLRLPWVLLVGQRGINRVLTGRKVDLVHSNTLAILSGAFWAWTHRIPHVWHVHEIIEHPVIVRKAYARLLLGLAHRVICVSGAVKANLLRDCPALEAVTRVVWNGLSRDVPPSVAGAMQYRHGLGVGDDEVLIVLVARINRLKGHALLMDAVEQMSAERLSKVRLLMVGDAPNGQERHLVALRERVAASPLRDRIILQPFEADIWKVLDACDIAVVPSIEPEAFGMVALEAMAAGKPVVAADHGGLKEIVVDGRTGLLVNPRDTVSLAAALSRLVDAPVLREELGAHGRERWREKFGLEHFEQGIADVYEELDAARSTQGKRIAVVGSVGVPANYGGFETLVENLVKHHSSMSLRDRLTVYCSASRYPARPSGYFSAHLVYVPFQANGWQSVLYDVASLFMALRNRSDVILLLGVSGAVALPLLRIFSRARIVAHIDGIEWRRAKWQGWKGRFLHFSEKMAVRYADEVISDNEGIAEYVQQSYGVASQVIAYGGEHAVDVGAVEAGEYALPASYAISVCRIEPENNVSMILQAFARLPEEALVMIGNWGDSEYGRRLRERYSACGNLFLLDAIYDAGKLKTLRSGASFYVHGHSAGGTNPSLVEAMHFGLPIMAFDCSFNRSTTEGRAFFFDSEEGLLRLLMDIDAAGAEKAGQELREIAQRRYLWRIVAAQYFSVLTGELMGATELGVAPAHEDS